MFTNTIEPNAYKALELIQSKSVQSFKNFYLAGGTAAAIQIGHRISVDLDFFSKEAFLPEILQSELSKSGIVLNTVTLDEGTLKGYLHGAQISFFEYPYDLVEKSLSFEDAQSEPDPRMIADVSWEEVTIFFGTFIRNSSHL